MLNAALYGTKVFSRRCVLIDTDGSLTDGTLRVLTRRAPEVPLSGSGRDRIRSATTHLPSAEATTHEDADHRGAED